MTVIEGMIIFAKLYRFGLGTDGKCMTISPDRFSPMRKFLESRDQNDGKVNINCFEYDFNSVYSCNDDEIITSKPPTRRRNV